MTIDNETLSRNIEKVRIEAAEAKQKYEELHQMFSDLYQDAFWLQNWIQEEAMNKLGLYSIKRKKFDEIIKKWEFDR
ncbi:MAG: hypothetical protein ACFFG0_22590 [Candidatus Thorarchaeota archaeon]